MKADITYRNNGLFTNFMPCSKQGEQVWHEIASKTDGTGKVLSQHAASTIAQLRNAGYIVAKASKPSASVDDDALLE